MADIGNIRLHQYGSINRDLDINSTTPQLRLEIENIDAATSSFPFNTIKRFERTSPVGEAQKIDKKKRLIWLVDELSESLND